MDGNLKMKTYMNDTYYVINHEKDSIYNDVVHFHQLRLEDATKSFNSFAQNDSTILVRGEDGLIMKKKGEDQFIAQNLAYLYNDYESQGELQILPYASVYVQDSEPQH